MLSAVAVVVGLVARVSPIWEARVLLLLLLLLLLFLKLLLVLRQAVLNSIVFGRNALECDPCWMINASKVAAFPDLYHVQQRTPAYLIAQQQLHLQLQNYIHRLRL